MKCRDSHWREWLTSKLLKLGYWISPHWNCNGMCHKDRLYRDWKYDA